MAIGASLLTKDEARDRDQCRQAAEINSSNALILSANVLSRVSAEKRSARSLIVIGAAAPRALE